MDLPRRFSNASQGACRGLLLYRVEFSPEVQSWNICRCPLLPSTDDPLGSGRCLQFDAKAGRIDFKVAFPRGTRFTCSHCGAEYQPVHDTRERTWHHLNFFQY